MSHPDRRPQIRAFVLAATALLGGLAAGIWANLLTGVESPEPWAFLWALRALEWSNLYLAAAIGLFVVQTILPFIWRARDLSRGLREMDKLAANQDTIIVRILRCTVQALMALNQDEKINARLFWAKVDNGEATLVKDRTIHIETDEMPAEYGLQTASVTRDRLVICESFKTRAPIYRLLDGSQMDKYNEAIRKSIDPRQRWVLASPVLDVKNPESPPIAVICFFSTQAPTGDGTDRIRLESLTWHVAETIADVIWFRKSCEAIIGEAFLQG